MVELYLHSPYAFVAGCSINYTLGQFYYRGYGAHGSVVG
jgi:hypothetical protein